MKKFLTLSAILLSFCTYSQKAFDQYSLEGGYGMGVSGHPTTVGFSHYEIGFRYMVDQFWGLKFDFGSDRFRKNGVGSDYKRYSVQGVHNLGRTLGLINGAVKDINLLAHGGLGYSSLSSTTGDGADKIGNVIIGLTPQLYISRSLALTVDTSFILNFTQHYNFDGLHPAREKGAGLSSFTGHVFTASLGLTYYFGRNRNDPDWR